MFTWYQDGTAGVCLHGTKMGQKVCVYMVPRWDSRCVLTWYQDGTAGVCLHGTKMGQQVVLTWYQDGDRLC